MFFVNLPLSYASDDARYLAAFTQLGINPELGVDALSLQARDTAWFKEVASTLENAGRTCSIHLPFLDLHPGSLDDLVLHAARERLARAAEIAALFSPRGMVGHVDYSQGNYGSHHEEWLERASTTWSRFLDAWPGHPPLYLENTFEKDPEPVAELVDALSGQGVGVCFDAGHWNCFAQGNQRQDMERWIKALGTRIRHLHLHDNDGSWDQHQCMGQGTINWDEYHALLVKYSITPSITLEPHGEEPFLAMQEYFASDPRFLNLGRG